MSIIRPIKLVRLLLATSVLAGTVTSSPTIGHAHPLPASVAHTHHDADFLGHSHSRHHHEGLTESDVHDAVLLGRAVIHLHGVWFGIPFSLPAPLEQQDGQTNRHPMAEAYLTPAAASQSGAVCWVSGHVICPDGQGPPHSTVAESTNTSFHSSLTSDLVGRHCALTARSGVLRC